MVLGTDLGDGNVSIFGFSGVFAKGVFFMFVFVIFMSNLFFDDRTKISIF